MQFLKMQKKSGTPCFVDAKRLRCTDLLTEDLNTILNIVVPDEAQIRVRLLGEQFIDYEAVVPVCISVESQESFPGKNPPICQIIDGNRVGEDHLG